MHSYTQVGTSDGSIPRKIKWPILILSALTCTTPLINLYWAQNLSSCSAGAPAGSYALMAGMTGLAILVDLHTFLWIKSLADVTLPDNFRPPVILDDEPEEPKYLKGSPLYFIAGTKPKSVAWMSVDMAARLVMFATGKSETLDQQTDFVQPGQVAACEFASPEEVASYQKSWRSVPAIGGWLHRWQLSTMVLVFLLFAFVVQVPYLAFKTARFQRGFKAEEVPADFKAGMRQTLEEKKEELAAASASQELGAVAVILAACGSSLSAATAAASAAQASARADPLWPQASARASASAVTAAWRGLVETALRCLMEACPSLWLAIAFLAMAFDGMGFWTEVKTVISMVLSFCTIAKKAYELTKLSTSDWGHTHKYTCHCRLLATLLIVFDLAMAVKFWGTFACDSHLLNLTSMACVA